MILFFFFFMIPIYSLQISPQGTYNSFRNQIGFCRLQSFHTISRSSSGSVPMFLDGRIMFGVGLSDVNMKTFDFHSCGLCLEIQSIDNFYSWNQEITKWNTSELIQTPFRVMVFDQCTDPICQENFLDFDIYSETQPVFHGNPRNVEWSIIPCPILPEEYFEFMLCTPDTCNAENTDQPPLLTKKQYFWSISIRNMRHPIRQVYVTFNATLHRLEQQNAWIYSGDAYDLNNGIQLWMVDKNDKNLTIFLNMSECFMKEGYHGALFFNSTLQN